MSNRANEDRLDAFFNTLSDEVKSSLGVLPESRDRLVQRMRKRAGFVNQSLEKVAIAKFLSINESLSGFKHKLPDQIVRDAKHFITVMLERFTTTLNDLNIQVTLDSSFLYDNWKFGPGASNGVKGTHAAQKIGQEMTCTPLCEPYVRRLRASNPYFSSIDWKKKRLGIAPIYGSRLTTVPKNEDTVRTIAIEPMGNMCLQLAAGIYLEGTLRYIGLDISKQQPLNKALALRGSIDGSLATIDLSSASDMFSIDLVRSLMPAPWFDLLMNLRSPQIMIQGKLVELNMISTMGNGFTFPLMTLMLTSLIYAMRAQRRGPMLYIDWSSTAVFGDDIIVPVEEYAELCELLTQAGLVVNHDKSYSEGPFRESCGGDYHNGTDITPFYVRNLRSDSDIYVAINQLLEWSGRNNFWPNRSFEYLKSLLWNRPLFVPEWLNPDQGILCSQVTRKYAYLKPKQQRVRFVDEHFLMPLACGGYISSEGLEAFFVPRPKRQKYELKRARLPRGFLDGSDLQKRSVRLSGRIAMIVAMAA
jgi:hypothetical protein